MLHFRYASTILISHIGPSHRPGVAHVVAGHSDHQGLGDDHLPGGAHYLAHLPEGWTLLVVLGGLDG